MKNFGFGLPTLTQEKQQLTQEIKQLKRNIKDSKLIDEEGLSKYSDDSIEEIKEDLIIEEGEYLLKIGEMYQDSHQLDQEIEVKQERIAEINDLMQPKEQSKVKEPINFDSFLENELPKKEKTLLIPHLQSNIAEKPYENFQLNDVQQEMDKLQEKYAKILMEIPPSGGKTVYSAWKSLEFVKIGKKVLYLSSNYTELGKFETELWKVSEDLRENKTYRACFLYGKGQKGMCKKYPADIPPEYMNCSQCSFAPEAPEERKEVEEAIKEEYGIFDENRLLELKKDKVRLTSGKVNGREKKVFWSNICLYKFNLLIIEYLNPQILLSVYDQIFAEYNHNEFLTSYDILIADEADTIFLKIHGHMYYEIALLHILDTRTKKVRYQCFGCKKKQNKNLDCSSCELDLDIYGKLSSAFEVIENEGLIQGFEEAFKFGKHFEKIPYPTIQEILPNIAGFIELFKDLKIKSDNTMQSTKEHVLEIQPEVEHLVERISQYPLMNKDFYHFKRFDKQIKDYTVRQNIWFLKNLLEFSARLQDFKKNPTKIYLDTNDRTSDGIHSKACGYKLATVNLEALWKAFNLIFSKEKVIMLSGTILDFNWFKKVTYLHEYLKEKQVDLHFESIPWKLPEKTHIYIEKGTYSANYLKTKDGFSAFQKRLEAVMKTSKKCLLFCPTINTAEHVYKKIKKLEGIKPRLDQQGDSTCPNANIDHNLFIDYNLFITYLRGEYNRAIDLPQYDTTIICGSGHQNLESARFWIENENEEGINELLYELNVTYPATLNVVQAIGRIPRDNSKNRVIFVFADINPLLLKSWEENITLIPNWKELDKILANDLPHFLNQNSDRIITKLREFLGQADEQKLINRLVFDYVKTHNSFKIKEIQKTLQKRQDSIYHALKELEKLQLLSRNENAFIKVEETWKDINEIL